MKEEEKLKPWKNKSNGMKSFLDHMTGHKKPGICKGFGCASTKTKPEDFRNETSKKEYNISGLCQECQDKIFGA